MFLILKKKNRKTSIFRVSSNCSDTICCCASGDVQVTETDNIITIFLKDISQNCSSTNAPIIVKLVSPTSGSATYNGQIYQYSVGSNIIRLTSNSCSFMFECISGQCVSNSSVISISFALIFLLIFFSC